MAYENHDYCVFNCGGTGCPAEIRYTGTSTPSIDCKHENGVCLDVSFWIFNKRIFVCTDCGEQVDKSTKED